MRSLSEGVVTAVMVAVAAAVAAVLVVGLEQPSQLLGVLEAMVLSSSHGRRAIDMTCQTCTHFLTQTDEQGLCRRNPPQVFLLPDNSTIALFPPMTNEGLCGEHKEKNDA